MRKLVAVAVLLAATLLSATPAEAFWRHHCGWGGGYRAWGGYRGYGYGGYGGWGYRNIGWGGYYRPYNRGWGYGYPGGYGGFGYSGYGYPYYSMGSYPTYNSYAMYSPYYLGTTNVGTYALPLAASVNNPLYATRSVGATTMVSSIFHSRQKK